MVVDDGGGKRPWRCGSTLKSIGPDLAHTPPQPPQLNIANPSTGQQHVVELEDEKRL